MKTAAELHIEADKARSARMDLEQKERALLAAAREAERIEARNKEQKQAKDHQGHSDGYDEVEKHYNKLAEMVRKLLAAN